MRITFMFKIPQLTSTDGVMICKDGCTHKLIIQSCSDADAGLYEFEVNGCRTQAMVRVGGKNTIVFKLESINAIFNSFC